MAMRRLRIKEPRVVIHEVCTGPFGILPVWLLDTPFNGDTSSGCESRSSVRGYLIFRVERNQMGGMPVIGHGFVEVFKPFLQLAVLPNLQRRQSIKNAYDLGTEYLIEAKQF